MHGLSLTCAPTPDRAGQHSGVCRRPTRPPTQWSAARLSLVRCRRLGHSPSRPARCPRRNEFSGSGQELQVSVRCSPWWWRGSRPASWSEGVAGAADRSRASARLRGVNWRCGRPRSTIAAKPQTGLFLDVCQNDHVRALPATGRTAAHGPQPARADVHHLTQPIVGRLPHSPLSPGPVAQHGSYLDEPEPHGFWLAMNIAPFLECTASP